MIFSPGVAFASMNAWRKVPGPESATLVTTMITKGTTCTVNEQLAVLSRSSFAVHVTLVVPSTKDEPDGGTHVTTGFVSQLSEATGAAHCTTALPLERGLSLTISALPHVIVGGTVSTIVER